MKKHILFGIVALLLTSCGDCGNKAAGIKQGDPLKWESIPLGANEASFKKALTSLAESDLDSIEVSTKCGDKIGIMVPDIDELVMEERSARGHILTNCFFQTERSRERAALIDIRGEFLDNELVRLSYRLAPKECEELSASLATRFGPGLKAIFSERFLLTEEKREYRVWTFDDIVWTMTKGESDTCLLTQLDNGTLEDLPKPAPASKKGTPVSLEDLGIGELDLKEKEPIADLPEPIAETKDASVP